MKELIDYIETLIVPQGRFSGEKMVLYPWQKRFIRNAWKNEGDAALSVGRGSGKTAFTSALAAASLNGPIAQRMAEVLIVASSFEQGLINFKFALSFLQPVIDANPRKWRVWDSQNRAQIRNLENQATLVVLGSDPRRLHGRGPSLILFDEAAQFPLNILPRAIAALETARGKLENSKMIWLGTRASSPDHPFEQAFSQVEYAQIHSAKKSDPPYQLKTIRKANPGIDRQPDLLKVIRQEARRAKMDSSALARYRAYRLNSGVSDTVESHLLEFETWERIEVEEPELRGPYTLGLDLGQNAAMSAAAGYWMDTGGLEAFACFPETPSLQERGLSDGVDRLYIECFERGELIQEGERVSDIPALLMEVRARWGAPAAIVCDRWREAELRQSLGAVKFPVIPLIVRGMGYRDGGQDVREFRSACLSDQVSPRKSLLLRSAMSGAKVSTDPAGNAKLAKGGEGRRARCRDDAAAAAILAVSEGTRRAADRARVQARPAFQYAIV